ncbi:MAG: class B sortase [Acutalibacteraceae bacterium]|jgi:sortase B
MNEDTTDNSFIPEENAGEILSAGEVKPDNTETSFRILYEEFDDILHPMDTPTYAEQEAPQHEARSAESEPGIRVVFQEDNPEENPHQPIIPSSNPDNDFGLRDKSFDDSSTRWDFLGTPLLLFALFFYGLPVMAGKYRKQLTAVVSVLLSIIILLGIAGFYSGYQNLKKEEADEPRITESPGAPATAAPLFPLELESLKTPARSTPPPPGVLESFGTVLALNPDVVGWLKIPGTSIDTVVTQDKNNTYYLRNDFYGKRTRYGNLFLDYRNDPKDLSQNTILHGHTTMSKLQVFNDLYKYMDADFYREHPIIEYSTLYKKYEWKVFSVYITSVQPKDDNGYSFYYIHPKINKSKFPGYMTQIIQRSRFYSEIGVGPEDKILTLSTCVYVNNFAGRQVDSRLVVAARLLREGESKTTDPSVIIDNPGYRRPQVWYNYYGKRNPYAGSEKWNQ